MLYDRKDLPELNYMKHFHDDSNIKWVKYDDKLFDKTLSPYMFENEVMNIWLKKMQKLAAILFDQMNVMKNYRNYMIDKYDYRQK